MCARKDFCGSAVCNSFIAKIMLRFCVRNCLILKVIFKTVINASAAVNYLRRDLKKMQVRGELEPATFAMAV